MMEWRAIPGYPGYEASAGGEIRSLPGGRVKRWAAGRTLKQWRNGNGYAMVSMRAPGAARYTPHVVSRLICVTFHGAPPFPDAVARHRDGDNSRNCSSNLEWGTQADNIADKRGHGTQTRGESHGLSMLTAAQVREIRRRARTGERQRDIANDFGVTQSNVSAIYLGKSWGHLEG